MSVSEWFNFGFNSEKIESTVVRNSDELVSFHGHLKGNVGSQLVSEVIEELTTCC